MATPTKCQPSDRPLPSKATSLISPDTIPKCLVRFLWCYLTAGRHVAPLGHIVPIPNQTVSVLIS